MNYFANIVSKYFKLFKIKINNSLFRNSLFSSSGFIFISLIGLIITPFLVINFGIEQYGIYILITSIFGYYGIFDLGLGQGIIKFISEYNSKRMFKELNDAVNSVFWTQAIIGLVLTTSIFIFAKPIIGTLKVSEIYFLDSTEALKIASIGFFFSMLASTFSSAIKGLELYGRITLFDSVSNLAMNTVLLVVLLMNYGIKEAVFVNVSFSIIQLLMSFLIFKKYKKQYLFKFRINIDIIKMFFSFSFFLFLSKLSNIFSTYVVRFIISFYLGPTAVTFYTVPAKLLGALGGVTSSAANVIFPYTSRLVALGKTEQIKIYFLKSNIIYVSFCLPIMIFIIYFSKSILTLWMGVNFAEQSWIILSIITLGSMFGSFSTIPNLVLIGLGNSKLIGLFSGIAILSYLIFIPLFTYYFKLIGSASALCITSLIVIGFVLKMSTKAIGIKFIEFFNKIFAIQIFPLLFISIITFIFNLLFQTTTIIDLFLGGLLILFYYLYLFKLKVFTF